MNKKLTSIAFVAFVAFVLSWPVSAASLSQPKPQAQQQSPLPSLPPCPWRWLAPCPVTRAWKLGKLYSHGLDR